MDKKYCKFCGKQINKNSEFCPKCGKKQNSETKKDSKENINTNNITNQKKFYEQAWLMWLTLILISPLGIFLMWKFHPEMKQNLKVVLTIVFVILFFIIIIPASDETGTDEVKEIKEVKEEKPTVVVTDFSKMTRAEIDIWCEDNNVICNVKNEYSDTVKKDKLISQSIEKTKTIYEGESITIIFSLGKEPTVSQQNALEKAESYLRFSAFSRQGLIEQLEFEQFSHEDAVYAVDNCGADWKEQAVLKAKSYLSFSAFSRQGLIDQLEFEGFTYEQAVYGVEQNGL